MARRPNTLEDLALHLIDRGADLNAAALDTVGALTGKVPLAWNPRFTRRLGQAECRTRRNPLTGMREAYAHRIQLAALLFEESAEALRQTFLHEVAHVAVGIDHGHDWVWASKMRAFDARPERCSQLSTVPLLAAAAAAKRERRMRHVATCVKCGFEYHRPTPLRFGPHRMLLHKRCGGVFLAPAVAAAVKARPGGVEELMKRTTPV